jgi:hypothetical protein
MELIARISARGNGIARGAMESGSRSMATWSHRPDQGSRKWNRDQTEAMTHEMAWHRRAMSWNPREAAWHRWSHRPIPLNKLRSQWHLAAATGNTQADGGVSTVATWHRGGDAIDTTASTWHHGGEPSGRPIQHGIRTRVHAKSMGRHGTGQARHGTEWWTHGDASAAPENNLRASVSPWPVELKIALASRPGQHEPK